MAFITSLLKIFADDYWTAEKQTISFEFLPTKMAGISWKGKKKESKTKNKGNLKNLLNQRQWIETNGAVV